ncbi:11668_t:CDS:2 [Entrophospora sp. SA101]|nr:11668_t:CDS:2 [Entrophospora sp. SA101]
MYKSGGKLVHHIKGMMSLLINAPSLLAVIEASFSLSMSAIENISPVIIKRISKELNVLVAQPPEGIRVIINELDVCDIQAWILGPEGTPYEEGMFKIKVVLGTDFPSVPPKCHFITKIFHPNVSKSGEVCVNTLKKDWNKDFGIERILLNPTASISSDNLNHTSVTPKKRVASSDKKLDKKQADKKRSMKRL